MPALAVNLVRVSRKCIGGGSDRLGNWFVRAGATLPDTDCSVSLRRSEMR